MDKQQLPARLVEQAPDAMIFADGQGVIQLWNAAATHVLGYTAQQAIGQSLDLIIPKRLRQAHWQGFEQAMAQGQTRSGGAPVTTKALCADGSHCYLQVSFALIRDEQGQLIGALAHARQTEDPRA